MTIVSFLHQPYLEPMHTRLARPAWITKAMQAVIAVAFIFLPTLAGAQCVAPHAFTFQPVQVLEMPGPTAGNAYAIAQWAPNGWPAITYGPRFFGLSALLKDFVKFHECAHLSMVTNNEVQANCVALTEMRRRGLSQQQELEIARWTVSEGVIGLQYGGTGENFWRFTLQCAGAR